MTICDQVLHRGSGNSIAAPLYVMTNEVYTNPGICSIVPSDDERFLHIVFGDQDPVAPLRNAGEQPALLLTQDYSTNDTIRTASAFQTRQAVRSHSWPTLKRPFLPRPPVMLPLTSRPDFLLPHVPCLSVPTSGTTKTRPWHLPTFGHAAVDETERVLRRLRRGPHMVTPH